MKGKIGLLIGLALLLLGSIAGCQSTPTHIPTLTPTATTPIPTASPVITNALSSTNDHTSDDELAGKAREILDNRYRQEVAALLSRFAERGARGLATADPSDAARAATAGGIDTLLVDIDADMPGLVDDAGGVSFSDAPSADTYDVIDEIAARALMTGARVMAVRKADLPDNASLAAILRFAV